MPKVPSQTELDRLIAVISERQDGLGIDAIAQRLGGNMQRRTLQRRLAQLVAQGRIQKQGEARASRYALEPDAVDTPMHEGAALENAVPAEVYVPVSTQGAEIKAYVRQPRAFRPPHKPPWLPSCRLQWQQLTKTISSNWC